MNLEPGQDLLAAVILKEIDFGGLPGDTPETLRRLLERCLERKPDSELRDIGEARVRLPQISPDGRWVSYGSNQSGRPEIYVRSITGDGQQVKVPTDTGERREPVVVIDWDDELEAKVPR